MTHVTIPWKTKAQKAKPVSTEARPIVEWNPGELPQEVLVDYGEIPNDDSTLPCACCQKQMPALRKTLLGIATCKDCTSQTKPKGVMDYSHKTGGVLVQTTSEKVFRFLKKPINQQR